MNIEKFKFQGDELDVVRTDDGDVAVPLRRLCEVIGVDYSSQLAKLKKADWACVAIITTHDETGRKQEMACVSRRSIPLWAASINVGKVDEAIRAKLVAYQLEAADVLADHFLGPRAQVVETTPTALADELARRESAVRMVMTAREALPKEYVETTLRRCVEETIGPSPAAAIPVAMLGTGGAAVVPVVNTAHTETATELAQHYRVLTARDVGKVADALGIRPSILRGETTYGVRVQVVINGVARNDYQARYNDDACQQMHDDLAALRDAKLAAKAAKRRTKGANAPGSAVVS